MTDDGYLRPHQERPLSVETDRLISDICPGVNLRLYSDTAENHPLWGPIVSARSGWSDDPLLRRHASSGGALSALLIYLLDAGIVDYVVQTGASDSAPLENATAFCVTREDVYQAAGSRYAPSAPLADLMKRLEKPGRFALVGKPCDIAAVRTLGRKDPRISQKIPVMLSFFCAGVPSTRGAGRILDEMGLDKNEVVRFRYRGDGWPGRATAVLRDGTEVGMSYSESWGRILSHHVQFRCKICPDGTGGLADIVCADAWHCDENGYPLFEEDEGRSLVITRTQLGEALVRNAIAAGRLVAGSLDTDMIAQMQPSQVRRKQLVLSRLAAMVVLGRRLPHFGGMHLAKAALSAGVWSNVRSFFGMARRLLLQ
jgi:coenzyme F420 hydrogenase subunit beta